MRRSTLYLLIALIVLSLAGSAFAQAPTATPANPNANITWPPPVYVLRGAFTIRGSANLPNMTNWLLEYQAIVDAGVATPDPAAWLPITLPSRSAIQDAVLAVWDTTTVPDGLWRLRLTINLANNTRVVTEVSPLRVENFPPPFAGVVQNVPTQAPQVLPTLIPTPTAFSTNPTATANRNANVRRGDGTQYEVIGNLPAGASVPIVGISSLGTGWYLIILPNGAQGWVAPSVVDVTGDFRNVPRINPPPPPSPTPIPITNTPASSVNLVAGNFRFDPGSPNCNQAFSVFIDIANQGSVISPPAVFTVQDFRRADGSFQVQNSISIPSINPGQTINVGPVTLSVATFYNEEHVLRMVVDPGNAVFENNESDNIREAIYFLNKAACP